MSQLTQQEFAVLFQKAHSRLWTLAAAIVSDRTQAEDVVQDAAIVGLRRLGDFQQGTNFTAWISQIVRFTALNHLKTKKNRKALSLDLHPIEEPSSAGRASTCPAVTPAGELSPDQQAFDDRVVVAMSELEPDRRACLLLRTVHGLDYQEIAQIVGVPAGTAMSHVHRAKASMRRGLDRAPESLSNPPAKEKRG